MEDRSSPPATTSYYRPPLGVRHLASVSARNVVPPGGPPKRLAGVGVFFTLHECSRDRRSEGAPLYTSEVVRDTLNPDWAPLDEALVDAAAARANSNGEREYLPPERGSLVALHEQMTLRVWFAQAPANNSASDLSPTQTKKQDGANEMERTSSSSFVLAFECDVSLGALVPVPGGVRGQRLVSLSNSGGRARAGAVLSAPPNTPLLKTRAGFGAFNSLSSFSGSIREKSPPVNAETSLENDPRGDFLNPHDGWVVPRSKAWPALLTAAAAAEARDDADAASTANEKEKERLETVDAPLETERSGDFSFAARATTRQIRVASEAILDATRRLRVASATAARLKARVAANVEPSRASEEGLTTPLDPALRAATAKTNLESFVLKRAALLDKLERARNENALLATATSKRAAALRRSRDALRGAEARLRDADLIVKGPHGVGRLRSAQRQLVSRRWRLVGDLAAVFPVTTLNAFGAEKGVRGKAEPKRDESGSPLSGSGDESFSETDQTTKTSFSTTDGHSSLSSLPLAIAGVPLDHTGTLERRNSISARASLGNGSGAGANGPDPGANDGASNANISARTLLNDPECAAAALGYVTQATLQLASVLDVPLRYPVAPGASRSYICDLQQVFQAGESESGASGNVGGNAESSTSRVRDRSIASPEKKNKNTNTVKDPSPSPSLWRRVEFPLFAEPHAAESTRFAYAVFLLNKDLEQMLNAHGMLAVGPRHTLQNLKRIFAARKKIVSSS